MLLIKSNIETEILFKMEGDLSHNTLLLWQESSLYIGGITSTEPHSHNAVQCCIALGGSMRIKWQQQWIECCAVIIDSNQTHSIACCSGEMCLLYLEKSSPQYVSINEHFSLNKQRPCTKFPILISEKIPDSLVKIANFFKNNISACESSNSYIIEKANKLRDACFKYFHCKLKQNSVIDSRVIKIMDFIKSNLEDDLNGIAMAESIALSESRMQHLFKQNIGIPIRRYILWARLRVVILHCVNGMSFTAASHAAGFSDSAHFSRTFKSMFGMKASTLINSGSHLATFFCE